MHAVSTIEDFVSHCIADKFHNFSPRVTGFFVDAIIGASVTTAGDGQQT